MEFKTKDTGSYTMSDEQIIDLYWNRDENAIKETDLKYRKYLFSIAYNIVHEKRDCEECLNDTYIGAWNAIPPTKPNVLKAFLATILRRVSIDRYHSNCRKSVVPSELTSAFSELEDFISDEASVDEQFDSKELGRVLSDYIRSLSYRRRYIFMSRYYFAEPIETIASSLSVSRSTVNKEIAAIKISLKEMLESEGYSL